MMYSFLAVFMWVRSTTARHLMVASLSCVLNVLLTKNVLVLLRRATIGLAIAVRAVFVVVFVFRDINGEARVPFAPGSIPSKSCLLSGRSKAKSSLGDLLRLSVRLKSLPEDKRLEPDLLKESAKHRFERPETSIDVHVITARAHQANSPLLSGKLTKARADLKIELV